jgi:zinc/manganese transport system substrate-binding protein
MILSPRHRVLAGVLLATVAAGCGDANDADDAGGADGGLVATTTIWADVTSHVACGEPTQALVPPGADPHSFELSLRDREVLEDAEVVVANGADLEESLLDVLDTVAASGTNVVEIAPHVDVIVDDEHRDGHDEDDGAEEDEHGHGAGADPHIWLDPTRVAGALDVIASALTATGRDAAEIEACRATYRDELAAVDEEIATLVDSLPIERRVLVTNHDSLAYFADRYGFEVLGTVIPSTSTMAETNPAQLERLAELIEERAVPAIFVEELESSADADALGERLGVRVVPLVAGSLTADGPAATYTGMLRATAETITTALAP